MLISPDSTCLQLWTRKQDLFSQLHEISYQPIDSSMQQRDQLEVLFEKFIYQQNFDVIDGGLIIGKKIAHTATTNYHKPIITNIYIAELLIAADQVFYRGDFYFTGKQILAYLLKYLFENDSDLLSFSDSFESRNLPCYFVESTITHYLDIKERQLLSALTADNQLSKQDENDIHGTYVCYTKSLREAASSIDMHYKEAQILEFSLLKKLKKTTTVSNNFNAVPIKNDFSVNCELLACLCMVLKTKYDQTILEQLKQTFYTLQKRLKSRDTRESLVEFIYSGIALLQLDFDQDIVSIIEQTTVTLDELPATKKSNVRIIWLEKAISEFQLHNRNIVQSSQQERLSNLNSNLIFLSKQQVDLETQLTKLRSNFTPNQLVFII